jgi:hypothetical protein
MPSGNLVQLGRQSDYKRKPSVLRAELRTVDPKSREKSHALANGVGGIYRRINDSATSERIHKIGVLPAQCSAVRRQTQSLIRALDL